MNKLVYKVVQHDGGWAYEALGTFSETYPTPEAAREAARLAAREQSSPEAPTPIEYEDEKGHWHREVAGPNDRPQVEVEG
jgi:hypothetical protein